MNAITPVKSAEIMEAVIAKGDLANLTPEQRGKYYVRVCDSIGLNPMTRPFEYITLNGKLTLYARKDCTDQLRSLHNISVTELNESERDGVFIVTAKVTNGTRSDAAKGAVHIHGLKGEALANAMMKAETKAKRRATLSICGLGFLDETEVEDVPAAERRTRDEGPPAPPTATQPLVREIAAAQATDDQIVWDDNAERPATAEDGLDIPANLRRAPPTQPATVNPEFANWRKDAEGALAGCTDADSLFNVHKTVILPAKGKVPLPVWQLVAQAYKAAFDRISMDA